MARDYKQYLVVSAQEAHTAEDIAAVVVRGNLRVRDLATVVPGTEDHVRIVAGDGRPAALINVTRQVGGNTVAVSDTVERTMTALARSLPPGVRLKPVYDQAALVRDAVAAVRDAILIGAVLAIVVLLLFLRHWRITAISAAVIPLTLAITVFVMRLLGQTFNLMTLGAMAIAIGLVIDDAVVITENIVRHLRLTRDRTLAVREAVQELLWPVTSSTLTTVVVFLPLGLLEGVAGQFFSALSLTLTIAVLVSLVLALTIIPLLAEQFLTDADAEYADAPRASSGRSLSDRYARALGGMLHHVRATLAVAAVLVAAGIGAWTPGRHRLPARHGRGLVHHRLLDAGRAPRSPRPIASSTSSSAILAATPEISGTSRRTGAELGLFATEQNTGDIVARLVPPSKRDRSIFEIMDDVREQVEARGASGAGRVRADSLRRPRRPLGRVASAGDQALRPRPRGPGGVRRGARSRSREGRGAGRFLRRHRRAERRDGDDGPRRGCGAARPDAPAGFGRRERRAAGRAGR